MFFHKFVVHKFVDFLYLSGVSGIDPGEAAREGVAVQPVEFGHGCFRHPSGQKLLYLVPLGQYFPDFSSFAYRSPEFDPGSLLGGKGLFCPLGYQVPLYLGGQAESERNNLGIEAVRKFEVVLYGTYHNTLLRAVLRIDMIISRLRPRRESSVQTIMSPLFILRIARPRQRFSQATVPDTDSVTHVSISIPRDAHQRVISYFWLSWVCSCVETRM